jgi:hypothetical protein
MENPLDVAGELVQGAGDNGAQLLFGIARFIEQLTGDVTGAAIFTAMLLFSLGLLRKTAMVNDVQLYAKGMVIVCALGLFILAIVSVYVGYGTAMKWGMDEDTGLKLQYFVLTGRQWGDFYSDEFQDSVVSSFVRMRWYMVVMAIVGAVGLLAHLSSKKRQHISSRASD